MCAVGCGETRSWPVWLMLSAAAVMAGIGGAKGQTAAADPPPMLLQVDAPATDADRLDLREAFRQYRHTTEVRLGWMSQHKFPTHSESHLNGSTIHLARLRYKHPRVQKGFEFGLASLGNGESTTLWSLVYLRRQFFHTAADHALYWQIAGGLCHLSDTLPEEAAHTNFLEHGGAGALWSSGRHSAWSLEYRLSHISCAGRRQPNRGLNCSEFLLGRSLYF